MTLILTLLLALTLQVDTTETYRVYSGEGEAADLEAIIAASDTAEVLFLGERHNDAVAHALQDSLLRMAHAQAVDTDRSVALSLEMFSRDVQYILDEYLAGLITEEYFLQSSRPWSNYRTDYRPLVEFARENAVSVIAANAPRRYVNRVSQEGRTALDTLSERAQESLPPLPYPEPSDDYSERWQRVMEQMPGHGTEGEEAPADSLDELQAPPEAPEEIGEEEDAAHDYHLDAQTLWDASMAFSMAERLVPRPGTLILHLTGSFHVEDGLGTPEMLQYYRPGTQGLVIVMRPVEDVTAFDEQLHGGLGDFVILTDSTVPPSF